MNGVEIGSAENIKFEINDDIKLDTPVVQGIYGHGEIVTTINKRATKRIAKLLFPQHIWAKGYYIVNKRGRNKLVEL